MSEFNKPYSNNVYPTADSEQMYWIETLRGVPLTIREEL